MESKPVSPQRSRGPSAVSRPSVAAEHGAPQTDRAKYAGSSRSSLFGLFRRQPSRSDIPTPRIAPSVRSSAVDSYFGAFDNISVGTSVTGLESPQQAYETRDRTRKLLQAAAKYRQSIEGMSAAAAEFGNTLYEWAETKGAASGQTSLPNHAVNADLQAAAGLHLLISSHANILASSVIANVEEPVGQAYRDYQERINEKEHEFRLTLRKKMTTLRESDSQRQKDARKRRDLSSYRSSLLDLTYQIDDINRLKVDFLGDIHVLSTELAESLHGAIASTVTAEIEVAESIARKGWTGGGLDGLLAGCPDPFEAPNVLNCAKNGTRSPSNRRVNGLHPQSTRPSSNPITVYRPHNEDKPSAGSSTKSAQCESSFDLDKHDSVLGYRRMSSAGVKLTPSKSRTSTGPVNTEPVDAAAVNDSDETTDRNSDLGPPETAVNSLNLGPTLDPAHSSDDTFHLHSSPRKLPTTGSSESKIQRATGPKSPKSRSTEHQSNRLQPDESPSAAKSKTSVSKTDKSEMIGTEPLESNDSGSTSTETNPPSSDVSASDPNERNQGQH